MYPPKADLDSLPSYSEATPFCGPPSSKHFETSILASEDSNEDFSQSELELLGRNRRVEASAHAAKLDLSSLHPYGEATLIFGAAQRARIRESK